MTLLSCPDCGYSKEIPPDRLPPGQPRVQCPKCRKIFTLDPGQTAAAGPATEPEPLTRVACPHCRHEKKIPTRQVPAGRHRLRCWQCGDTFEYLHPAAPADARGAAPGGGDGTLPPVIDLFTRSWQLFKERIWTLLGIYLATVVAPVFLVGLIAALVVASLAGGGQPGIGSGVLALLFALLIGGLMTWGMVAMLVASVDATADFRQALTRGGQHFWSFGWLFFLLSFMVAGGFFLLGMPGFVFMTWFLFAQYLLVDEEERGMCALLKSREYVRGYFWAVLLRLLVLWVAVFFLSLLLGWIPVLGGLMQLLLFPFTLLYQFLVLQDLRQARSEPLQFSCTSREKLIWIGIAALGYLVLPVAIWLADVPARFDTRFQRWQQQSQGTRIESPVGIESRGLRLVAPGPRVPADGLPQPGASEGIARSVLCRVNRSLVN